MASDGWRRLMLSPADYAEDETALFHPLTRRIMHQIDFRHGGPDYDRRYPDGIPTTVELSHAKLGPLRAAWSCIPKDTLALTRRTWRRCLRHKCRLLAGPAVDDVDALVSRFTNLAQKSPAEIANFTISGFAE